MADLNLSVGVNTDDLTASLQTIVASLQGVESSGTQTGEALTSGMTQAAEATAKTATATRGASEAMGEASSEARNFGTALDELGGHVRTVSMGLGALGLEAGESAEKVLGLIDVLGGLQTAVPEMLILAAAFTTVFAAVDAVKDAISEAADLQQNMSQLSSAIQGQGGDWDAVADGVHEFLESASLAAGVSMGELVPAMRDLVLAGHDVHDSETLLSVALEVHAARGKSVEEVTEALIQATEGHARALEKLDPQLKAIIDAHGTLQQVVNKLNSDMGRAIENSNSYEAEQARLKVTMEGVSETLGTVFLPMLESLAKELIGAVKNGEEFGKALVLAFGGTGMAIAKAAEAAFHFTEAIGDIAKGDVKSAMAQFGEAQKDTVTGFDAAKASLQGYVGMFNEVFHGQSAYARGNDAIADSIKKIHDQANQPLDDGNAIMGKEPKVKIDPGIAEAAKLQVDNMDDVVAAWQKYFATLSENDAATNNAKNKIDELQESVAKAEQAVKLATTTQQQATAEEALAVAKKNELAGAEQVYNNATAASESAVKNQTETTRQAGIAFTEASNKLVAYEESVKRHGDETERDKEKIDALKASVADAKTKDEEAQAALDKKSEAYRKNAQDLEAARKAQQDYNDAVADSVAKSELDLNTFIAKTQTEIAVQGMTVQQKLAYYQQDVANNWARWQALVQADDAGAADEETILQDSISKMLSVQNEYDNQVVEAQKKLQDQLTEQRKKAEEEASKDVDTFLDDILEKHESFQKSLKDLMDDIEKQYVQSFSSMVTGSSEFQKLFGLPAGGGASPNPAVTANTSAVTTNTTTLATNNTNLNTANSAFQSVNTTLGQTNTIMQQLTQQLASLSSSGSGGQGPLAGSPFGGLPLGGLLGGGFNPSNLLGIGGSSTSDYSGFQGLDISTSSIQALTGSPLGVMPNSVTAQANTTAPSTTGSTAGGASSIGSDISGGLSIIQGLSSGGTFGEDLSGAGSIVGGLVGGPVGAAIGSIAGSLLGGLFGNHTPTEAQNPDIVDKQFGQIEANFFGTSDTAADGPLTKNQTTSQDFDGQNAAAGMERLLAQGEAAFEAQTGLTAQAYQQDLLMFGQNATASGVSLKFPTSNDGIWAGTGQGASGQYGWQQYESAVEAVEQGLQNSGATDPSRVFSLVHSMPNFEQTTLQAIGTFAAGVYSGSQPVGQTLGSAGTTSSGSGLTFNPNPAPGAGSAVNPIIHIPVTINGPVVGTNGMSELATTIENMLIRNRFNNAGNIIQGF